MSETAEAADGQMAPEQTYSEYPAPDYPEQYYEQPEAPQSFVQRFRANKILLFGTIGIVVIMLVAAGMLAGGGGGILGGSAAPPAPMRMTPMTGDYPLKGPQVPAQQTMEFPVEFGASENDTTVTNVYEVSARCSWTDDYSGSEPDSMTFELVSPSGQNISQTSEGSSGSANLVLKDTNVTESKMVDNTAGWVLKVRCNFAGHKDVGPFGFLIYTDAGNNFDAQISYKFYGHEGAKTNSTM